MPAGFVVGAPAYAAFCDGGGLRARIAELLAESTWTTPTRFQRRPPRPREMVGGRADPAGRRAARSARPTGSSAATTRGAVAVRSSATAEDTESASFAGMNETFLNVRGADAVVDAVRRCWASLFGARTVFYRAKRGFGQADMDIAVVVQRQVESTRAGVMFTLDPGDRRARPARDRGLLRSRRDRRLGPGVSRPIRRRQGGPHGAHAGGSPQELVIESLPEGGTRRGSSPLTRRRGQYSQMTRYACSASSESRSSGTTGNRRTPSGPSTRTARLDAPVAPGDGGGRRRGRRARLRGGELLLRGLGAAPGRASGPARPLSLTEAARLEDGDVLVTHMTAPDWVPLMRRAAAIVTDSGGTTCHAAIVSRELGIPCIVGTAEATRKLRDGEIVTVDATRGVVLEGDVAPIAREVPESGRGRPRGTGDRDAAARQSLRAVAGRPRGSARRSTASACSAPSSWCSRHSAEPTRGICSSKGAARSSSVGWRTR